VPYIHRIILPNDNLKRNQENRKERGRQGNTIKHLPAKMKRKYRQWQASALEGEGGALKIFDCPRTAKRMAQMDKATSVCLLSLRRVLLKAQGRA
jgi:hypothetical protein